MLALDHIADEEVVSPLIRGLSAALSLCHSRSGQAEVDTSVVDRKRLGPFWGTTKRKGVPGHAERPHRRTAFVCTGGRRATADDLRALIDDCRAELGDEGNAAIDKAMGIRPPRTSPPPSGTSPTGDGPWRRAKDVPIHDVLSWQGLLDGENPVCPGCGISDGSSVAVVGNGLKCSHARCAAKGLVRRPRSSRILDVARELALYSVHEIACPGRNACCTDAIYLRRRLGDLGPTDTLRDVTNTEHLTAAHRSQDDDLVSHRSPEDAANGITHRQPLMRCAVSTDEHHFVARDHEVHSDNPLSVPPTEFTYPLVRDRVVRHDRRCVHRSFDSRRAPRELENGPRRSANAGALDSPRP
jgi:hypothetical protein